MREAGVPVAVGVGPPAPRVAVGDEGAAAAEVAGEDTDALVMAAMQGNVEQIDALLAQYHDDTGAFPEQGSGALHALLICPLARNLCCFRFPSPPRIFGEIIEV